MASSATSYGKNVKVTQTDKKITIEIDVTKDFGLSKSKKSKIIATTEGNVKLENGIALGLNCYTKANGEE